MKSLQFCHARLSLTGPNWFKGVWNYLHKRRATNCELQVTPFDETTDGDEQVGNIYVLFEKANKCFEQFDKRHVKSMFF